MAGLPRYGRKTAPAGPSQWEPGATRSDIGLEVIEETLGRHAEDLRKTSVKIRAAQEGTQLLERGAKFSIGMQKIFTDAMKLDNPEEQRAYWEQETKKLSQQTLDWPSASGESRTELKESLTRDRARGKLLFIQGQEDQSFKQIRDSATLALETAVSTNNPVAYQVALNKLDEIDVISPAMREQRMKEFPAEVALAKARMQLTAMTAPGLAIEARESGIGDVAKSMQTLLADKGITDDQRTLAERLYNGAVKDAEAMRTAYDKAEKEAVERNGQLATGRVILTEEGKAAPDQIIAPSQLAEMVMDPDPMKRITSETARVLTERLQSKGEIARERMLPALARVNQAMRDLGNGVIGRDAANAVLMANINDLDRPDAKNFIEQIQGGQPGKIEDAVVKAAGNMKPTFDVWAPTTTASTVEKLLARQTLEGDFEKRLTLWARREFPDGNVDRIRLNEEAVNIANTMQQERKAKPKEKGPGLLSRLVPPQAMPNRAGIPMQRQNADGETGAKIYSRYEINRKTGERRGWDGTKWVPVPK